MKSPNSRIHHRMCLTFCRWIVFCISWKHMPAISKVIWSFWEMCKTKFVSLQKPSIFLFQIIWKMTKNVENCGHAFLTSTTSYLSTKNEIHSMMSPWLKTRQKTWFLCKDKYFRQKMWLRVLFFLLSYRVYKNWTIVTRFFISLTLISMFSLKSVEEISIC